MQRCPVIGVVGRTKGADPNTSDAAETLGYRIVSNGGILLTGGRPGVRGSPRAVKDAAMDGAVKAGEEGKRARMLGILPSEPEVGAIFGEPNQHCRCLLLRTTLTNHERNYLTGGLPDGLIALAGGAGTLSEIGLGLVAGKPVVLLESLDRLRQALKDENEELHSILTKIKNICPQADTDQALVQLRDLLEGRAGGIAARSPAEAANMIMDAITKSTSDTASPARSFVAVPGRTVSRSVFEKLFTLVSET